MLAILMLSTIFNSLASSQPISNFSQGVVFSSDETIEEAQTEIELFPKILPQYGTQPAKLFRRGQEEYTSVVLFSSESEANDSQNIIENEYARGVFVVNLEDWCHQNWSQLTAEKNGIEYFDCQQ